MKFKEWIVLYKISKIKNLFVSNKTYKKNWILKFLNIKCNQGKNKLKICQKLFKSLKIRL